VQRTFAAILLLSAPALPAAAAPPAAKGWTRSFVVTAYEPAFLYGSPANAAAAPGCPKAASPDNDYHAMLATGWRSQADIAAATAPAPNPIEPYRLLAPALHQRGFRRGIDTYIHPFAAPDPGLVEAAGSRAEGFDLDGRGGGFTAPGGARGIDNALYRAWGCLPAFRGGEAPLIRRANARMQDGLYTMAIRISGEGAAPHDGAVTVEIGNSPDRLVRSRDGTVLPDYSYRLARGAARFTARLRGAVLTAGPLEELRVPAFAWSESNRGAVLFRRARLRLTLAPDGAASGLIGGYRDWRELYAATCFNVAMEGPDLELAYHQNQIAMYYALQRNADAFPDTQGRNTAISTAWRLAALPAFVVDPATPVSVSDPVPSLRIEQERQQFRAAQKSRQVSPSP
jgi:hypothetical protein